MNILIYFPYNHRTVEQQSVIGMLAGLHHKVVLLTTLSEGYLHNYVRRYGVATEAVGEQRGKLKFYWANLKKLASVVKEHKIDVVIAHQQQTALIAGMLRKIKPSFKLVYVRHNSDEDYQGSPVKSRIYNRLINNLTPVKVAPSTVVKDFWVGHEKAREYQISLINYGYDFEQYEKPVQASVERIKQSYPARLRLLSVARLIVPKKHKEMFTVIKQLVEQGYDCKLLCLGSGPLAETLKEEVKKMNMQEHIFLLGQKQNVIDYIDAADVFIHLSSSEASNSAVKEAGICSKTVIVCKGVGDFEDYIVNGENGFLVNKNEPAEESYQIVKRILEGEINPLEIGLQLHQTVTKKFEIDNIQGNYNSLLQSLKK